MRVSKAQKIRLGVFIFSGFLLIILLVVIVAGNKLMEKRDIYYVEYTDSSVNGLSTGGAVKYHGIDIGRVDKIEVNPKDITRVIVTISVTRGTPIKEDVEATLVPVGITGLKSIELTGGTNEADLLPTYQNIKPGLSTFDNLSGRATSIAEKLEQLVSNLNELTNPQTQRDISQIIANTNDIVTSNKDSINNTIVNLDRITYNADRLVGNLAAFSDSLDKIDIADTIDRLNTTIDQTTIAITNIDRLISKNRINVDESLESLRETLESLNEFARQINEDPSVILRGSTGGE